MLSEEEEKRLKWMCPPIQCKSVMTVLHYMEYEGKKNLKHEFMPVM